MHRTTALLFAAGPLLIGSVLAQETNPCPLVPATKLEAFETNTDTVIIKATAPLGAVQGHGGTVSVRCREITDAGTGRWERGLVIDLAFGSQALDSMLIDYDELGSLLDGLEYLAKVDWSVTTLTGFDAVYTTKGGFRAAAFGSRRTGNIQYAVRDNRVPFRPLLLSRDQLTQLRSLVQQTKAKLDSLSKEK